NELGVSRALERKEACDDRQLRCLDALQELFETAQVENWSGDRELSSRFDLVLEAAQFFVEVWRGGIDRHTDVIRGRCTDGLSAHVATAIEPRDQVREADRVDIEHHG